MWAAPDYKELYFALFRASEQAVRVLRAAQAEAERRVMDGGLPPLRLHEPDDPAGPETPPDDPGPD